ncbi:MAG TPA: hypothetical protein PLE40_02655, partial [Candidatus Pacearchaeota archaeon]|nr:hypothetical protein [Candidatus Pacearchaeota archaeon]
VIGWTSFKGDTYGVVIEPEPTGEPSPTETTDGNGDCNQNQPSIEVSPSFQEGYRGNSLTYHLTITNNDSSDCLSSNFSSLITDNSIKTNSCLTYSPTKVFGPQKISPQNSVKTSFTVTIKDNCEEGRTYESEIETIKDTLSVNTLFKTKVLKPTISPPPSCFKCSFINNSNYYKLCNELTRLNIASGIVGANDWIYIKFPITDITSFTLTRDVGNIECRYINNSFDDSNKDCAFDKNNLGTAAVRAVAGRFSITLRVEYSNGDVCEENYEFNGYSGIGNAWRELPSF